jgi:5-methylcytosine-specific restriction endonuclease McrA
MNETHRKIYKKAKNFSKESNERAMMRGVPTNDITDYIIYLLNTNHKCHYCGKVLYDLSEITFDHKIAMSLGGSNTKRNIVMACYDCNHKKARVEGMLSVFKNQRKLKDEIILEQEANKVI